MQDFLLELPRTTQLRERLESYLGCLRGRWNRELKLTKVLIRRCTPHSKPWCLNCSAICGRQTWHRSTYSFLMQSNALSSFGVACFGPIPLLCSNLSGPSCRAWRQESRQSETPDPVPDCIKFLPAQPLGHGELSPTMVSQHQRHTGLSKGISNAPRRGQLHGEHP